MDAAKTFNSSSNNYKMFKENECCTIFNPVSSSVLVRAAPARVVLQHTLNILQ